MSSRKADEVILENRGDEQTGSPINSKDARNKYEAAIVAAMEARRLNDITRVTGESLSARVTQMAIENVRTGRVHYFYEVPGSEAEAEEPAKEEPTA